MKTVTLCFKSVLDLCEFLRQVDLQNVEVELHYLKGKLSSETIHLATTKYHASILENGRKQEILN